MYKAKNGSEFAKIVNYLNQSSDGKNQIVVLQGKEFSFDTTLIINFNLTIKSDQGASIFTNDGTTIFKLSEGCEKFTINSKKRRITLKNASSQKNLYGGAISSTYANQITLKNVDIIDSVAVYGGAIYTKGSLSLFNSEIKNNTARDIAGGIYVGSHLLMKKSTIKNCTVINPESNTKLANVLSKFYSYSTEPFYGAAAY
ncbi:MAG: hypothetical protein FJZ56_03000 [Chlamydiae bacterium]|nr:hypothetical protein [Chlamydiota bacterium]